MFGLRSDHETGYSAIAHIRLTKAFPSFFLCSSAKRMGKGIKVQVVNCHSGLGCQWVHVGPLRYHQLEVLMLVLAN